MNGTSKGLEPHREQAAGVSLQVGFSKILREQLSETINRVYCQLWNVKYEQPVNTVTCDVKRPQGRQDVILNPDKAAG